MPKAIDVIAVALGGTVTKHMTAVRVLEDLRAAGYEIVPREPTPEMIEAAYDLPGQEIDRATRLDEYIERYDWKQLAPRAFSAMIGAAITEPVS